MREAKANRRWLELKHAANVGSDFADGLRAEDDGRISRREHDGSVYVDMVATSRWVFTPPPSSHSSAL